MANFIIDIGNSFTKLAVFRHGKIQEVKQVEYPETTYLEEMNSRQPDLEHAILSSVNIVDPDLLRYLEERFTRFIHLDENTPLPIKNLYRTKDTLGKDRIAAAVGANNIFPGSNVLVIDAGTALTFELVTADNQYIGGNISPGLRMRFKALHQNTEYLPLLSEKTGFMILGNSTEDAIVSGIQQGMILEIDGFISLMKKKYRDLKVVLTGGDCNFFDKKLKSSIFVNQNLILAGLDRILTYNVTKR
ncbi:MAG: type III pantothenate kinase [Bacteroidales bacterium]|nr:MAG: type III pantothenate kinase [Bacteroidales bacterium]